MVINRKKYAVIVADPPWQYNDKKLSRGGAERYYRTIDINNIKQMNVSDYAADDCLLLLWVTAPFLKEGIEVVSEWGFTYKTVGFTWVKRSKLYWEKLSKALRKDFALFSDLMIDYPCINNSTLADWFGDNWIRNRAENGFNLGMGSYTRANSEYVLLGTKGKAAQLIKNHGIRQIIDSVIEDHSTKPQEFYERVSLLVGDVPKLDLFTRKKRVGFDCLGNELESPDYILDDEFKIKPVNQR